VKGWIYKILDGLIKVPPWAGVVESVLNIAVGWYLARQTRETLRGLSDAAALAARATTQAALDAWATALSRPRVKQ
jgi:hypothetical protein